MPQPNPPEPGPFLVHARSHNQYAGVLGVPGSSCVELETDFQMKRGDDPPMPTSEAKAKLAKVSHNGTVIVAMHGCPRGPVLSGAILPAISLVSILNCIGHQRTRHTWIPIKKVVIYACLVGRGEGQTRFLINLRTECVSNGRAPEGVLYRTPQVLVAPNYYVQCSSAKIHLTSDKENKFDIGQWQYTKTKGGRLYAEENVEDDPSTLFTFSLRQD